MGVIQTREYKHTEAERYLQAMRVPHALEPQEWGLWQIKRFKAPPQDSKVATLIGWPDYTILLRQTMRTLHLSEGEIVMEDSRRELARHLPICLAAYGRVLVTGLGLGCVVRGLLANPRVQHVDVVEIDPEIIRRVWPHVGAGERATVYNLDANDVAKALPGRWDFAWHDLFLDDGELAFEHLRLVKALRKRVGHQGCWGWDRRIRKVLRHRGVELLGI